MVARSGFADPPQLRDESDSVGHDVGGIGAAAPWDGCQIGGVGLDEDEFARQDRQGRAQVGVRRVSDGASEGGVPAVLGEALRHCSVPRIAVEDDALIRARALAQDRQGVLVGVAVVDLQGEAGALRHLDVRTEGLLLRLAARVGGAEIVQAALPHRDDHRVAQARLDGGQRLVEGHVMLAHLRGPGRRARGRRSPRAGPRRWGGSRVATRTPS